MREFLTFFLKKRQELIAKMDEINLSKRQAFEYSSNQFILPLIHES